MVLTRIVQITPSADNVPPKEDVLGYTLLSEPLMERKVPVVGPDGRMPPPVLIEVKGKKFFVIGYTWSIPELSESATGATEATYVLIVQAVPEQSSIIKVGAQALDHLKAVLPAPTKQ